MDYHSMRATHELAAECVASKMREVKDTLRELPRDDSQLAIDLSVTLFVGLMIDLTVNRYLQHR